MDLGPGPDSPERERAVRARRREAAKRHHPDLGGDPDEFIRAMRGLEEAAAAGSGHHADTGRGDITILVTGRSRARHWLRRSHRDLVRGLRSRIPRPLPGARRYAEL
jgi:hypothetical protein